MGTLALCSSNSWLAAASSFTSVNEALCSWSAYCTYLASMLARNIFSLSEAIANSVKCPRELSGEMRHKLCSYKQTAEGKHGGCGYDVQAKVTEKMLA
ncbi:hypothetical protein COO60DRAFT_1481220 [Scenedesmus sp. NREL 46B-D3]|nr:hypothetical protein COO60DRAFT_1481220 [Scenedesmus sp. NREL 46B-D3]